MHASKIAFRITAATGLACASLALTGVAHAQDASTAPMSVDEVKALPADMQSAPVPVETETTETLVGPDGVETIVRTRRIDRPQRAHESDDGTNYHTPSTPSYAPVATVVEREEWIAECEARTSGRSEREKGGIIGGLLGAITGGIIGNRVAGDGDRLLGTVVGAGTGGLGGVLLGNLIGSGKKGEAYDCEAALDGYLSQYGQQAPRIARRTVPAPAYPTYGGYAPQGYYGYAPAYGYSYAPPQQIVYVPIRYEQQQRVVVRENVREETYTVPGRARTIEERAPAPSPKLIKQPRALKSIKN
ncbi:hypothetical protein [Erythrobacter sp. THAF29]|uniref:hypothetical protein n=1 Tax=Erythrobacter sp. THAF29 TaxID=2587851 RepID=UPI001268F045|nr:hypothetical protein [Erythrobacter sp. THAF29]QFT76361.1 hypothetical protein FIU90_02280 [Erythrobacter sp. THAF29]